MAKRADAPLVCRRETYGTAPLEPIWRSRVLPFLRVELAKAAVRVEAEIAAERAARELEVGNAALSCADQ